MKDMILFPEDIERLNAVLTPLVSKSKLLLAVLINRDGRILTHQGCLEHVDIVSLAALVAGNTASTHAIANLMGESEFSAMYHQGKEKNIYIDAIDENTFLSVVFDDQTNIDRVKVFIRQFERQLKESLTAVYDKDEDQIDLDLDIGTTSFPHFPQDSPPMAGASAHYQKGGAYPPQNPVESTNVPEPIPAAPSLHEADPQNAYLYLHNKMKQNHQRTPPPQ